VFYFDRLQEKIVRTVRGNHKTLHHASESEIYAFSPYSPETGEYIGTLFATHDDPYDEWESYWWHGEWAHSLGVAYFDTEMEEYYASHPDGSFGVIVYAAMTLALQELDKSGFFGSGEQRAAVLVYSQVSDHEDCEWLAPETAIRLNSASVLDDFLSDWQEFTGVLHENLAVQYENYSRFQRYIQTHAQHRTD